jgi:hypothetical protein
LPLNAGAIGKNGSATVGDHQDPRFVAGLKAICGPGTLATCTVTCTSGLSLNRKTASTAEVQIIKVAQSMSIAITGYPP